MINLTTKLNHLINLGLEIYRKIFQTLENTIIYFEFFHVRSNANILKSGKIFLQLMKLSFVKEKLFSIAFISKTLTLELPLFEHNLNLFDVCL